MKSVLHTITLALGLWGSSADAVSVTWTDDSSIKEAAATIAYGLVGFYTGNNTGDIPGNLPNPYYWWEAGAMFGALIDYWWMTGDSSYNDITMQAMLHQVGPDNDYMPPNQTLTEGNDDQGFWALAAMSAAERKYPNPPSDKPQWLALAQAVFNEYVSRWDTANCDGGMRWQIFTFNAGYGYKNSISNGCFFNLAARLARYTGNQTYSDWATKVWDWETQIGLLNNSKVYDGATIGDNNCASPDTTQWSYNSAVFLYGAAVMYNITENSTWQGRLNGLLGVATTLFANNSIIYEQFCERTRQCNLDQQSFKGYVGRWLAATIQIAPYTHDKIYPVLLATAKAAAAACTGTADSYRGHPGTACGYSWLSGSYDGLIGVGPQMNAMSMVMYTLIDRATGPYTAHSGGTSKGDPNAGNTNSNNPLKDDKPITRADKAGAIILTILVTAGLVGGTYFVLSDEDPVVVPGRADNAGRVDGSSAPAAAPAVAVPGTDGVSG
ncbi:glycosyl hydrolase family 76-domain-containing protein [Mariannaea sp. PMI_226]|nr:glycosyl hydrolase family 76-domain-containing protein [Mariannaea sp. PMI_226]